MQPVAVAYYHNRKYNGCYTYNNCISCSFTNALPFVGNNTPHICHQYDERHVQYPAAGSVAQFAFSHSVKKELKEPGSACQCAEQIIFQ